MVIVLNNADFSARNLGKIDLSTPLDATVINILNKLTKYPIDMYNETTQAFNILYKTLVDEGLLAKMKMLAVPYMSASIQQAGYDIISDNYNDISLCYNLSSDGGLRVNNNQYILATDAYGYGINYTSVANIAFFGIHLTKTTANGGLLSGGGGRYTRRNWINRDNSLFQCFMDSSAVSYNRGAFGGIEPLPNGAFVISYGTQTTYYKDSSLSRETSSPAYEDHYINNILPFITSVPITCNNDNEFLLVGASTALTSVEADTLFTALNHFLTSIQL